MDSIAHKRILLTGASGVVGGALLAALRAQGAVVRMLTRKPGGEADIACDLERFTDDTARAITDFTPDTVVHAAWVGTENHHRDDPHLLAINTEASLRLLEIAIGAGCKRWIGLGSQAEYSPDLPAPIAETASTLPQSAYGQTKLALYVRQQALCTQRGVGFVWLRLFTCYSHKSKPSYVIPYLIDTMRRGEMPQLNTPHAVWDFLHAEDAAAAMVKIIAASTASGIYNLASGEGTSVGEVALLLAKQLGFTHQDALADAIRTNRTPATYRVADITKISRDFSWQPRISLEDGLSRRGKACF